MENNTVSNMESKEAREALAAAREVEDRAEAPGAPRPARLGANLLASVAFGAVVGFTLQDMVWPMLGSLLVLGTTLVALSLTSSRSVRTSIKQDVRPDEPWDAKTFWRTMVVYPVVYVAIQALPKGNATVSVTAGVLAALVSAIACFFAWRRERA